MGGDRSIPVLHLGLREVYTKIIRKIVNWHFNISCHQHTCYISVCKIKDVNSRKSWMNPFFVGALTIWHHLRDEFITNVTPEIP